MRIVAPVTDNQQHNFQTTGRNGQRLNLQGEILRARKGQTVAFDSHLLGLLDSTTWQLIQHRRFMYVLGHGEDRFVRGSANDECGGRTNCIVCMEGGVLEAILRCASSVTLRSQGEVVVGLGLPFAPTHHDHKAFELPKLHVKWKMIARE
jgi:hypothetical protein